MADGFKVPQIGPKPIVTDPQTLRTPRPATGTPATSFKDTMTDAVGEVQRLQTEADVTIRQLVSGEIRDVTQAMVAVEKADVAFQTMMAVRNKMVAAYQEVMRMSI